MTTLVRTGAHVVISLTGGSFSSATACIRASAVENATPTNIVDFTCTISGSKIKLENFTTASVIATDFDITFSAVVSGAANLSYTIYTVDGTDEAKYKVESKTVDGATNAAN